MSVSSFNASGTIAPIAQKQFTFVCPPACSTSASYGAAALYWSRFGLNVIPIMPHSKIPAVKWDPWLDGLSAEKVADHWSEHADHEVGAVVGDNLIVFDADSRESIASLAALEVANGVKPSLVVKTAKGEHHHFFRANGTYAKADSHSTEVHPERIDVKTGRGLVILPPSSGKTVALCETETASELIEASQDFIDAVFLHNGRPTPRPSALFLRTICEPANDHIRLLQAIIRHIDPDRGYDQWIHSGMALHHATGGSDAGRELFDTWSGTGEKYKGSKETDGKWRSFRPGLENVYTIRTLIWMAAKEGFSLEAILAEIEPFDTCEGANGIS
jgi:Primase C terminal 2 (PriCT-2)/Bifunctional DNA primase/polymerase, N-terminal